MSLLLKLP